MDTNLQKYQAFVRTAELGSFSKAASELHYSQSGVSRMVADLERDWQLTLLERRHGCVRLTSVGTKLLPLAKSVVAEMAKMQMEVDSINGLQSGLIRIGTFSGVAPSWLPGVIKRFQAAYPAIDYEIMLGDYEQIEAWLLEGGVDCGFTRLPTHPDLEASFLEQDKLMAVLPPGHPLARLERFPIAALQDEPHLLLEKGTRDEIGQILGRSGVVPHVHLTTWDDHAILEMVQEGLGISILPQMLLERVSHDVAVRDLNVPAYRDICIAVRNRRSAPLAVQRFLEFVDGRAG